MIITHIQTKEGGRWEPYTGVCDWEKEEFTGLIDYSHAYKFDNGDTWDKVGGWRDPMGWFRDPIFGFLDTGRKKPMHGIVAYYEPPKRTTAGIIPIIEACQEQFDIRSTDYKFDEFIDTMTQIIIGEELCSRHLWQ